MNPHEVLEIPANASADEVKSAYHRLAKKWHPDRFSGAEKAQAEERFRLISEAFNALKDSGRPREPEAPASNAAVPIQLQEATAPRVAPQERTVEDWYNEAMGAFEAKDLNRALALIQYALRLEGNRAEFHVLYAKILDQTDGDKKALVKALEAAIRLNPKDSDSMIRLAELFQSLGMHARASALWQKAHDRDPNHPVFHKPGMGADESGAKTEGLQGLGDQFKLLVEQAKALFNRISKRG